MAVELNQSDRGASWEVSGAVGARNWRVAHRAAWSTHGGGRMKSGDGNPAPPAKWCSVWGLRKLYGALSWIGWRWARVAGPRWSGSGSRGHAVRRKNSGELVLGQGWERVGEYGRGLGQLYRRGQGAGSGIAWCGHAGPSAEACSGVPEQVEHVWVFFCPSSNACWAGKRANLAKNLV
jgi:hypothetical protein